MTRNLKDLTKKSFVFTLALIFALSGINPGWSQTPAISLPAISPLSIPDSLGRTTDSFIPLSGRQTPLLIHIEDAHAHFATQSKIREILNYLHREHGVDTVFIEGASGKIDTELFNIFPDPKMNVKAAERWMKEGQFSGAEVFGIENGSSVNLQGVENQKLYLENLKEFRETHKYFESNESVLNEWNSRLKQLKAKIYLGDLKKWDDSADQFASEKMNVLEYAHVLKNLAEKNQISTRKFVHLQKLFDLESASKSVSIPEWQKEWNSVKAFIANQVPASDSAKQMLLENWTLLGNNEFVIHDKNLLLAKDPRLYFEILVTAGERYGFSFESLKELPKVARFLISQKEIASPKLFSEVSDLEFALGGKLVETRREREVFELDSAFRHLNRLFHLAVDRGEWNQIRDNQKNWNPSTLYPRIQKLENEIFKNPKNLNSIDDPLLSHALNFYRLAFQREEELVQNSLKQMTASNVSKAVLITGGFHSEGIREKLKKADFGYLSIHPSVIESGEESRYLEIMLGRRNILPDFYFNQPKKNSLATPAQLPHPARLILRTVLESGPVISQSQSFRDAFGSSFDRLAQKGALNGVFPSNPVSAEIGGTAEDLKIFLETAEDKTFMLDIPRDSAKVPSIGIMESATAQSLGSKRNKGKGSQPIDISRIGIWGFRNDPMKTMAAALAGREVNNGKRLHVDIFDFEKNIKSTELQNHEGDRQPIYDKAKKDGFIGQHFIEEFPDPEQLNKNIQSWQLKAIRENAVIMIDPGTYPSDGSLEFYESYIAERAQGFGKALYLLRKSGDLKPRIFAIRNQVRAHLTEEVMQIILNAYKEESRKAAQVEGDYDYDTGFTVVHIPDLFRGGQQMKDMETQKIIFGFPDLKNVVSKDVLKKNPRAIKEFKSVERRAEVALRDLLIHPDQEKDHYLKLSARSAELAPFGIQLYLFTKLLTFTTFSQLVHALGGDMEKVSIGSGLDYRIGFHFTKVAFGIGGRARKFIESKMTRLSPMLKKWIETLRAANNDQIKWFQKIIEDTLSSHFGLHELSNQEIAVLGVTYKSKNGSLMGSPSLDLIRWLIEKKVGKIYISDPYVDEQEFLREIARMKEVEEDPIKKEAIQRALRLNIFEFRKNPLEAIQESKAAIIGTDHPEFKSLTPEAIAKATKGENGDEDVPIFDGRNLYSPVAMGKAKINYISIGRQSVGPKFGPTKDWDAIENVVFDKDRTGMKVAMIGGTGYVALTTGAVMADTGHQVTNLEVQVSKVEKLNQELERAVKQRMSKGIDIGIHEPGLDEIIIRNYKAGRLKYVPSHTDKNLEKFIEGDPAADAIAEAEVVYIGVGTPEGSNGEADLSYILGATRGIGQVLKNIIAAHPDDPKYPKRKVIVVKSTVPPFAFEEIKRVLETEFGLTEEVDFDLASNPEFLREGQAVEDVFRPVRTVLGVKSEFAAKKLRELWFPLEKRWPHKVLITDVVTAPLIKYLSNVFLAISISFVNALAWYAQDEGASITQIVQAMKSDHRISAQAIKVLVGILESSPKERFTQFFKEKNLDLSKLDHLPAGWEHWPAEIRQYCKISSFLGPGIGWGGSCFPKDLKAANSQYKRVLQRKFGIIDTTIEINDLAPERVYQDIVKFLDKQSSGRMDVPLKGKKITVLGGAFKGDTDDVRETRTLPFVLRLLEGGAEVVIHDPHPKAMANLKALFVETILYSKSENPLIGKVRLMPAVAELKTQLQKANLKLSDSEARPVIDEFLNKIFGPTLSFEVNPDFKGDKNMTEEQKREEFKKEMRVIAESTIDSDMVVIVTDWEIFKSIDLKVLYKKMTKRNKSSQSATPKSPIIYDARNLLTNRESVQARKFFLLQVGERPLFPANPKIPDSSLGKIPNGDSATKIAEEPDLQGPPPSAEASSLGAIPERWPESVKRKLADKPKLVQLLQMESAGVDPESLRWFFKNNREEIKAETAGLKTSTLAKVKPGTVLIEPGLDDDRAFIVEKFDDIVSLLTGKRTTSISREERTRQYFILLTPDEFLAISNIFGGGQSRTVDTSSGLSLGTKQKAAPAVALLKNLQKILAAKGILVEITQDRKNGKIILMNPSPSGDGKNGYVITVADDQIEIRAVEWTRGYNDYQPDAWFPVWQFSFGATDSTVKFAAFHSVGAGDGAHGFVEAIKKQISYSGKNPLQKIGIDGSGKLFFVVQKEFLDWLGVKKKEAQDEDFKREGIKSYTDQGFGSVLILGEDQESTSKLKWQFDVPIQAAIADTAGGASLGFYISDSARKLVAKWVNQIIDAGRQFVNTVLSAPADISPDARIAASRIFSNASANLPGELVVPIEAQSDESLLKVLEPIALQLRGESKKDVSIFATSALKSKVEIALKSLKVDGTVIHDRVHFKSSHESLELYLIGRTAKFGDGRVVLIGDSETLTNVSVPGVRKISRDQVRSDRATQDIQQKDRLVAQVAAIDFGFDLLSASEWIPQPDKLQQDGNMLFMKEDFFTQYAEKWIAQMHAQMAILIAA